MGGGGGDGGRRGGGANTKKICDTDTEQRYLSNMKTRIAFS